ncbi:MAG: TonB-dependent receptor plug domain-containing protein [Gammaproteobacteria bacterium]
MRNTTPSRHSVRALAAAISLAAAGTAIAQNDVTNLGIEEVVVTAQKRSEDLQAVPIAISALTATDIERRGFNNSQDLINAMPNLAGFASPGARSSLAINMRGVGGSAPANLSNDPGVGIYIDGVILGKQIGNSIDVAELERIEVLRGPQGTLYGRNSTGGTINFITRKPSGEFGGKVTGTAGSDGLWGLRAHIDSGTLGTAGEGPGTLKGSLSARPASATASTARTPTAGRSSTASTARPTAWPCAGSPPTRSRSITPGTRARSTRRTPYSGWWA